MKQLKKSQRILTASKRTSTAHIFFTKSLKLCQIIKFSRDSHITCWLDHSRGWVWESVQKSCQLIFMECVKRGCVWWWDRLYAHTLCHSVCFLHMLFPHYSQLILQAHTPLLPFLLSVWKPSCRPPLFCTIM